MADHYFSRTPSSAIKERYLRITASGISLLVISGSGVFSKDQLDLGTEVLVRYMQLPEKGKLLDLGCGIGVVGIIAKKKNPALEIFMSDVNERAVKFSKKNCKENKTAAEIRSGDGLACWKEGQFDCILINPPQHAGKDVCLRLIQESYQSLSDAGTFQLVARRQKGGKTLALEMEKVFGNVEEIAKKSGFGVWMSRKTEKFISE